MWSLVLSAALAGSGPPDALVAEALATHGSVQQAQAQVQAAQTVAERAGLWSDLKVSVAYSNAPFTTGWIGDHPMGGIDVKLAQRLQLPGWSAAKRAPLEAQAALAQVHVWQAQAALRGGIEAIWWKWARARALGAWLVDHTAAVERARASLEARYLGGGVRQVALLRLDLLEQTLEQRAEDLVAEEAALLEVLMPLVGDGAAWRGLTPELPAAGCDWPVEAALPVDAPSVAVHGAKATVAEAQQLAAKKAAQPGVEVLFGVRFRAFQSATDPGTDLFTVGLAAPLPSTRVTRAKASDEAAQATQRGAQQAQEAALDAVEGEWRSLKVRQERAVGAMARLDEARIPQAQQLWEAMVADLVSGREDGLGLLDAERTLFSLQEDRVRAVAETCLIDAQRRALVGEGLGPQEAP